MSAMIRVEQLEAQRSRIWALCYRLTGVAADADDLVQETFARALEHPPADSERELAPWLLRVASNASLDLLRRRKTQRYVGEWLPSPVACDGLDDGQLGPEARYGRAESLSYAFLIALEALSATQRGVLILRDVLGLSVEETAHALGLSEANVKTSLHRARNALEQFDATRTERADALARGQQAMMRFVTELAAGGSEQVARLLAQDVQAVNDGGGEFLAALRPVLGRERVFRFFVGLRKLAETRAIAPGVYNGLPALLLTVEHKRRERAAARSINLFEVDAAGQITRIYSIVATRKLAHVRFPSG